VLGTLGKAVVFLDCETEIIQTSQFMESNFAMLETRMKDMAFLENMALTLCSPAEIH